MRPTGKEVASEDTKTMYPTLYFFADSLLGNPIQAIKANTINPSHIAAALTKVKMKKVVNTK